MGLVKSSGNVFEDLGFEKHEATVLQAKTTILIALEKYIEKNNLTQAQAAKVLGVPRPRMNRLLKHHNFSKITLDKMTEMATRAGLDVEVRVKKPRRKKAA